MIAVSVAYFSIDKKEIAKIAAPTQEIEQPANDEIISDTSLPTHENDTQDLSVSNSTSKDVQPTQSKFSDNKIISNTITHTANNKAIGNNKLVNFRIVIFFSKESSKTAHSLSYVRIFEGFLEGKRAA